MSHSHSHGGQAGHDHGYDDDSTFRANAEYCRTLVEQTFMWGSATDLVGKCIAPNWFNPIFFLSGWGWAIGGFIGYQWAKYSYKAELLENTANNDEVQKGLDALSKINLRQKLLAEGELKDDDNTPTPENMTIDWHDWLSIQAHIHDEETLNWAFFLCSIRLLLLGALAPATSLIGYFTSSISSPFIAENENIGLWSVGALVGLGCIGAHGRTTQAQIKKYNFWMKYKRFIPTDPQEPSLALDHSPKSQLVVSNPLPENNNHTHDSKTLFRAGATFVRTLIEHIITWGGLFDFMFGLKALFLFSGWGWAIGITIGLVVAYLDCRVNIHVDSANDETRQARIQQMIDRKECTMDEIDSTPLNRLDQASVFAHIHDRGTINWSFLFCSVYTIGLGYLGGATSFIGYLMSSQSPILPVLENIFFRGAGALIGYQCTKADKRTKEIQFKRFRFLENRDAKNPARLFSHAPLRKRVLAPNASPKHSPA